MICNKYMYIRQILSVNVTHKSHNMTRKSNDNVTDTHMIYIAFDLCIYIYIHCLMVSTPLKNMKAIGIMTFQIYGKMKKMQNVPNHQPVYNERIVVIFMYT